MNKRDITTVMFDMDGTIIHTTKLWDQFLATFVGQENIQNFRQLRATETGRGMEQTCNTLRNHFNMQEGDSEIINMFNVKAKEIFDNPDIGFIEGFEQFHDSLKSNNIKTMLTTNAPNYALNVLRERLKFQRFFGEAIYNSCMVGGVFKPDPKILLYAMKVNRITAEECVIFEDTAKGITAARSAKIGFVIGVNSNNNKSEFEDADTIVDNFANLTHESLIQKINSVLIAVQY